MRVRNPEYEEAVHRLFERAIFVGEIGTRLVGSGPGWCETELGVEPRHFQQNGFVHAGVEVTLADHTAGGAATTLIDAGEHVRTIELQIHLLRPARGDRLRCRARVLKPGRTFSVVESEVFSESGDETVLAAKASVTLAIVSRPL